MIESNLCLKSYIQKIMKKKIAKSYTVLTLVFIISPRGLSTTMCGKRVVDKTVLFGWVSACTARRRATAAASVAAAAFQRCRDPLPQAADPPQAPVNCIPVQIGGSHSIVSRV